MVHIFDIFDGSWWNSAHFYKIKMVALTLLDKMATLAEISSYK